MDTLFLTAFAAGIISFLSPCVLPLVPPYLCFLGGAGLDELMHGAQPAELRRRVMIAALLFVAGFSTVFVTLGASASLIGQALLQYQALFTIIAGVLIIIMGAHFLGLFSLGFLNIEKRIGFPASAGPGSAYVMGLAFAFGWTPCIGPVLAGILALAAVEATLMRGVLLLGFYALGLGIPFLLAAFALPAFLRGTQKLRGKMVWIERIAGAGLVLTGIALLTGQMTRLSTWLLEALPMLGKLG